MSKHDAAWFNEETNEVHSPKGRFVYPNLIKPRGIKDDPDSTPKFSVTLLIPAAADITALKKLAGDAAESKFGKDWKSKKLRSPFLKTADYEKLADVAEDFPVFIRTSANEEFPPFLFGPDAKRFNGDGSDIYGGRWGVVTVRAYAYENKGNKGVAFGLQRVQLLDHDDPIGGGRVETASGFEAVNVKGKPKDADAVWGEDSEKPAAAAVNKSRAASTRGQKPAQSGGNSDLDDEIPF